MRQLPLGPLVVAFALFASLALLAPPASASTLTFTGPSGFLTTSDPFTVESGFAYGATTDTLYRDGASGNPAPGIIGIPSSDVTHILTIVRDGGNPLFTFDSLDVYQNNLGATQIVVTGKLNNVVVASDSFTTSATNFTYTNFSSFNLAGQTIDALEINLRGYLDTISHFEGIDNVTLTPIPEPTTLTLLTLGGLALLVRRRLHNSTLESRESRS